jgi:polyhydroxybutyrate depolymerase
MTSSQSSWIKFFLIISFVLVGIGVIVFLIHEHRVKLQEETVHRVSSVPMASTSLLDNSTSGRQVNTAHVSSQSVGTRSTRSLTINGIKRNYTLFVPRAETSDGSPHPILFAYHPAEATPTYMEKNAPFHLASGTETFVVIYPEGYGKTFNAGGCCGAAYSKGIDDVGFFKAIMADVATLVPIRAKAYVTGFSNGSFMTYRLICDVPQLIEAAVPFAGAIDMTNCVDGYKIPIMHMNGASDTFTLTGVGSSPTPKFQHAVDTVVPPYTALDSIATRNGCTLTHAPSTGYPAMDASCEAYAGCPVSAPVTMCLIPNLGHAWPGTGKDLASGTGVNAAMAEKMGPYRPELDSTEPIVEFFLKH